MLDIKLLRDEPDRVKTGLKHKKVDAPVDDILAHDVRRRELGLRGDELKHRRNVVSEEINRRKKAREDAAELITEMREVGAEIKALDSDISELSAVIHSKLIALPNLPSESSPVGTSEADNVVIREWGSRPVRDFKVQDHLTLGEELGLFDFKRGSKISGSGFPLYTGKGARLERSIINFMLDVQTQEHGYTEIMPPFMTNRDSSTATGQLPKMEEDMYMVEKDDLFLVPTAEVPVTNIHRDEVLNASDLPVKYTAYSPCFRREAGSYGKDTRGFQRLHQFNKVEMVQFAHPDSSYEVLDVLVTNAQAILQKLQLHHRVIELCTADLSFAAAKCFDIELWSPAEEKWLEVSSCSNFEDFQARRGNIKFRDEDGKLRYVHTLNGSGVATPRLMIAILETWQQADGSLKIPDALVPYFGAEFIRRES